jgi:nucleoside-diphosphate-sugar epimerase
MSGKVLVTGASGFIGTHCLKPLQERGYEVHAVSTHIRSEAGADTHWHRCDLLQGPEVAALLDAVRPSHLLHLAWYVVPGKLISAPENFDWVMGSLDLVKAFAARGGRRVVSCGSGYEYDWRFGYCSEAVTPQNPDTVYGSCKRAFGELLHSYASVAGLSAAVGRVFFLYGPHENQNRLVASVVNSLLQERHARCSHGRQIRDYMHVQDVANALVALLDSELTGSINIASGQATTIRDLVLAIGRLMKRPDLIQLGALPARPNDAALVVGDNARLVNELGWTQTFELEAGLQQTIDWWRARQ